MSRLTVTCVVGLLLMTLHGCGGSGGGAGSTPPASNSAPSVDAGADLDGLENSLVQLSGFATDPDGDLLNVTWSQVSGPAVEITSPNSLSTEIRLPPVPIDSPEVAILELVARDASTSSRDQVAIRVESNDFLLFRAEESDLSESRLFKYDTRTDALTILSGSPGPQGEVINYLLSPDGGAVAYLARTGGASLGLFAVDIDGSSPIRLSATAANPVLNVIAYQWAPDSSRLVYVADPDVRDIHEAFTVNRDGTNHVKISADLTGFQRVVEAFWSPDGRYVSQRLSAGSIYFAIDVHDTTVASPNNVRLMPPAPLNAFSAHLWSADGPRIVYLVLEAGVIPQAYSVRPDGTDNRLLIDAVGPFGILNYSLAPDSSAFLYQTSSNGQKLFAVPVAGGASVRIDDTAAELGTFTQGFAWAPQADRIAYVVLDSLAGNELKLFTARPDGSETVEVSSLQVPGRVRRFAWSPDGSRLVYSTARIGSNDFNVFVGDAAGGGSVKVNQEAVGTAQLFDPETAWAPNGERLAYLQGRDLYVATLSTGTNVQVTGRLPEPGFAQLGGGTPWSADSSRIAYIVAEFPTGAAPGTVKLMLIGPDGQGEQAIPLAPGARIHPGTFTWSP